MASIRTNGTMTNLDPWFHASSTTRNMLTLEAHFDTPGALTNSPGFGFLPFIVSQMKNKQESKGNMVMT